MCVSGNSLLYGCDVRKELPVGAGARR